VLNIFRIHVFAAYKSQKGRAREVICDVTGLLLCLLGLSTFSIVATLVTRNFILLC